MPGLKVEPDFPLSHLCLTKLQEFPSIGCNIGIYSLGCSPEHCSLSGSPHVIPTLSRGVGPSRGEDGHTGPLPSFLWDCAGVSTECSQGSGSSELGLQLSPSFPNYFCFCSSRQLSFIELGRSLIVGKGELMNALGTSIYL